jgi:hypothetical protein
MVDMKELEPVKLVVTAEVLEDAFSGIGKNNQERENFTRMVLDQLCKSGVAGDSYQKMVDNVLEIMTSIKPRDHIEGLLATQMLATHNAMMNCFSRVAMSINSTEIKTIEVTNILINSANKLARTYAMQIEALSRYRSKGQQKMTVEHVHINSGGQAIIGNVNSTKKAS